MREELEVRRPVVNTLFSFSFRIQEKTLQAMGGQGRHQA
ncbi:hypothetical protein AmDm5_2311 [Acetobacter malorum]|nr:hypothetical protein AmDm5_2311 [Acetobacter malorum]